MTTLIRTAPATRDLRRWYAPVALLLVLGCLALLGLALLDRSPDVVERVHPAPGGPAVTPRPDDAATLLNNTPLAIAPADALAINAARKVDRATLTVARPFLLGGAANDLIGTTTTALDCLTQAVFYEAASENDTGQHAVAQVVLNRVRSPLFPHSVCGVIFQGSQLKTGCQFSFTCDGSLARRPSIAGWARARRVAVAALAGKVEPKVGLSTHYHADYVVPYWASSLDKVATIGAHIFYTMRGGLGRPASFREPYDAGAETPPALTLDPAQLEALSGAAGGDALAGGDLAGAPERTVVREDALGLPSAPAPALSKPVSGLRADEKQGELMADAGQGTLDGGR